MRDLILRQNALKMSAEKISDNSQQQLLDAEAEVLSQILDISKKSLFFTKEISSDTKDNLKTLTDGLSKLIEFASMSLLRQNADLILNTIGVKTERDSYKEQKETSKVIEGTSVSTKELLSQHKQEVEIVGSSRDTEIQILDATNEYIENQTESIDYQKQLNSSFGTESDSNTVMYGLHRIDKAITFMSNEMMSGFSQVTDAIHSLVGSSASKNTFEEDESDLEYKQYESESDEVPLYEPERPQQQYKKEVPLLGSNRKNTPLLTYNKDAKSETKPNTDITVIKENKSTLLSSPKEQTAKRIDKTDATDVNFKMVDDRSTKKPTPMLGIEKQKDTSNTLSSQELKESDREKMKLLEKQVSLLQDILATLGGQDKSKLDKPTSGEKEEGGIVGSILSSLFGKGLKGGIKSIMSNLFRGVLKGIIKTGIVGLVSAAVFGLAEGFKVLFNGGSFIDALTTAFGSFLEFITFGLIDTETLKNLMGSVSEFFDTYVIQPVSNFFSSIKDFFVSIYDTIVGFFGAFEIPKIGFTIPIINKEVSIGPFKPFASDKSSAASPSSNAPSSAPTVSSPTPNVGEKITNTTMQNASARDEMATKQPAAPVVVSSPTTNIQNKQNITLPQPVRNPDISFTNYISRNRIY